MRELHSGPVVLVALARGGWIPARLIGASFESAGVSALTLSLSVNYRGLGTREERAVLTQGFDERALRLLAQTVDDGGVVWLVDGPYGMGGVAAVSRRYLVDELGVPETAVKVAVLHWVRFQKCTPAPWRVASVTPPDAYARQFIEMEKPYIDYPWEHVEINYGYRDPAEEAAR
jgi:hypoxanthine phosphoribosyltransferase